MVYIWNESKWIKDPMGDPVIVLFARDTDTGRATQIGVKNFIPYFYAPSDEVNRPDGDIDTCDTIDDSDIIAMCDYDIEDIKQSSENYLSCFGDSITRVEVSSPDQVPYVRSLYSKTFDADILFDMRYLIDKGISYAFDKDLNPVEYSGDYLPRIIYWDIEVRSPHDIIPDPRDPIWPIVLISACDSYTGDVKVFSWGMPKVRDSQVCCRDERDMISQFARWVAEIDPEIVTGWYTDGFDIPYYVDRSRLLKVYVHKYFSRIDGEYFTYGNMPGRMIPDMMEYFKDWSKPMGKLETYGLKAIVKKFLGYEYDNLGGDIDQQMREEKWEELVKYSEKDATVLKELDDHIGLYAFYENLRKVMGVKLTDVLGRSKMIETLLMRRGIKPMPTRIKREITDELQGALVLSPPIGVHSNVAVFDIAALYPTLIIMYDISPDIDKMIPKVIIELMEERDVLRRKRLAGKASEADKISETSLKYVVNSFYGYLFFVGAKLFDVDSARKITGGGREVATNIHGFMNDKGYPAIYGDTDSTFAKGIVNPEIGLQLQEELDNFLLQWTLDQGIGETFAPKIKFEKLYDRLMFKPKNVIKRKRRSKKEIKHVPAKKRYAGHLIWKDGYVVDKMDVVGMEIRRSDSSPITKELMVNFLEKVLIGGDTSGAIKMVKDVHRNMVDGNVPILEAAIPKNVKKRGDTAWWRGIDNATERLGIHFNGSESPKLLYCNRPVNEICITNDIDIIPMRRYEDPDGGLDGNRNPLMIEVPEFEVDWDTMALKNIEQKFRPLLIGIGVNWNNVIDGQKTLGDWV